MADDRAQRMADWIVANADKKGTPEFETVVSAFKELKATGARDQGQPAAPAKPPAPDVDSTWSEYGKNLLRQAGQGLTFNFGDEITAGARSLFGDETYDQALADERAKIDEFHKRNPWASTAANVGGALVGGGGVGVGLRAAAKGAGTLGRLATGATNAASANPIGAGGVAGAGSGALAGFGEGEGGFENRVASAGMGALVGGAGGAAAGALISSVPAIKRVYQERIAKDPNAIRASAEVEVGKALERSGKTPDELKARLEADRGLGVPSTLMNADDELAKTGEVVVAKGGKGAASLEDTVAGQRAGSPQRTYGNLQKGIADADYYASEDAILDSLKKTGATHYENAPWMSQDVTDPKILKFLETPDGKKAFSRARSIIEKERIALEMEGKDASHLALKDLFKFDKDGNIEGLLPGARPDLRTLDLMKRGMDAMIDDGFASANGLAKSDAVGMKKIREVYLRALDDLSPDYRQARAAYRGDAEVRDALEAGKKEFMGLDPQGMERLMAGMSDGEKEAFKIGAMKSIRDRIFNAVDNADPTKKAGENVEYMRQKLRALVGDPEKADLMMDAMHREAQIVRQGQRITGAGQSRTARLGEAIKDFDSNPAADFVGGAMEAAASPKTAALRGIINWLGRKDFRMTELKADEVAKILRSGTPDEIDAIFQRLQQRQAATEASNAQLTGRARSAGQAVGDQSAEAVGVDDPSTKRPVREITIHPPQRYAAGGPVERKRNFAHDLAAEIQRRVQRFDKGGPVMGALEAVFKKSRKQTVKEPVRNAFPGIYDDPREIARKAEAQVAPEDPALKQLFGVTRDDLHQIGKDRTGNADPLIKMAPSPRGSAAAEKVMNPRNERRLIDAMGEAQTLAPELTRGMVPWYVMDPAFQRLVQLVGEDEAKRRYTRLNTLMGMSSPGSEVLTEINRGTAANHMAETGQFDLFKRYGGLGEGNRGPDFPPALADVVGHPYHSTSQAGPMEKYLEKGEVDMQSPKVPLYIQASGVPETGFQTSLPVPDAHFTRASGMSDVRTNQDFAASMRMPEYQQIGPWWRDRVAKKAGLESVPAQALTWGLFSPQTGVTSPIGAPKLELFAKKIMEAAERRGLPPDIARDKILMGETYRQGGLAHLKKARRSA
jgi:hypothetical protein